MTSQPQSGTPRPMRHANVGEDAGSNPGGNATEATDSPPVATGRAEAGTLAVR